MKPYEGADSKLEFTEEIDGYRLTIWKNGTKRSKKYQWRTGYILLPKGHQLEGKDYDQDWADEVVVHGGVTYADWEGDRWEIGFDCMHARDNIDTWTLEQVRAQLLRLLEQVRA